MMPLTGIDPERWRRVDAAFSRVLAAPSAEWPAVLDDACAGDAALRSEVEALLAAHEEARGFLESGAGLTGLLENPAEVLPDAVAGTLVGPYRLLSELGRGGMGAVYLAERADGQWTQRVALKRIRSGFGSESATDRFRLERQILARLEHPNITRLIDGGVDDEGFPYLVMEYVEGVPLSDYCDDNRCTIEQRVALFATVCRAVHYAHQNLVIHRDLKPSNILVTTDGQVKLLDFGIAKLLDSDDYQAPLVVTQTGVRLLTPSYASPEQVRGEAVSTASDVYTLGVILFELLTGRMPYRLATRSMSEIERIVSTVAPERPSAAVLRESEPPTASERAARRGTTPGRLHRRLRGDLDTIILTALRKEPQRRYPSALGLAEDLTRFLEQRPVQARGDTVSYRLARFVRRNRAGVAASVAVLAALVIGLGVALWQARVATLEVRKTQRINQFLQAMLASADPDEKGRSVTVAQVLDAAAANIGTELRGQPAIEAEVRGTIGMTYNGLGLYDDAEQQIRRSLALNQRLYGSASIPAAIAMNRLAMIWNEKGRYQQAERLYRQAIAIGNAELPTGDTRPGEWIKNLALCLQDQGRYAEAERLYRQAIGRFRTATPVDSLNLARALNDYATLQHAQGRLSEAETLFRELLALDRRRFGNNHSDVAVDLNNLSQVVQLRGHYREAEQYVREAIAINRRRTGEHHPETAFFLGNLASILQDQRRYAEAERTYRESLAIQRATLGPNHYDVAQTLNNIASLLIDRGAFDRAQPVQAEAVEIARTALGPEHPLVWVLTTNLARIHAERGQADAAERLYREALAHLRADMPDHHLTARALVGLGTLLTDKGLTDRGSLDEAEPLLREGLRIRQATLTAGDWQIGQAESALGALLAARGRYTDALPLLRSGLRTLEKAPGAHEREIARARARYTRAAER